MCAMLCVGASSPKKGCRAGMEHISWCHIRHACELGGQVIDTLLAACHLSRLSHDLAFQSCGARLVIMKLS